MVEQWNKDGETVEPLWWNSRTMMVEQLAEMVELWNNGGGTVEQWNRGGRKEEQ